MARAIVSKVGESTDQVVLTYRTATTTTGAPAAGLFHSTIVGRSKMVDLSADLCPRIGIERIPLQQIMKVDGEAGPNGESVYKPVNDKFDQIRFVGGGWANNNHTYGQFVHTTTISDYVEITFYGTGLNTVIIANNPDSWLVSVDGGLDTALVLPASISSVLSPRNYNPNQPIPIVSNLSLGIHTVRIKNNSVNGMPTSGFEILNESSSIKTSPGSARVNGSLKSLSALDVQAYNSGFESGTLGTRGGHVVVYMKETGTIAKAVTPTDTTAAYLTSASHANEEVIRTYNWREFGTGRSDDFSTLSSSGTARAFTLDDGTATLVASSNIASTTSPDALQLGAANSFITITFVGTGLDWTRKDNSTGTLAGGDVISLFVDGVAQGNINSVGSTNLRVEKIVSGLAYGTHTVKISRSTAVTFSPALTDFIVYGPKKPSVPAGAVELADYFVMGNYTANTTAGIDTIGTGLLRKFPTREHVYSGASWTPTSLSTSLIGLQAFQSTTNSGYVEYTFFGTGFEYRSRANTTFQPSLSIQLQASGGSLLAVSTTNYTISHNGGGASGSGLAITTSTFGGFAFTPASGNLSQAVSNTDGSGFTLSGLPLGLYKVKIIQGSATIFEHGIFDIITPIHTPKINGPFVVQNTLSVGSQGISDNRPLGNRLADTSTQVIAKDIITGNITSTTLVPLQDMQATIYAKEDSMVTISFSGVIYSVSNYTLAAVFVDGQQINTELYNIFSGGDNIYNLEVSTAVSKGYHHVKMMWKVLGGTGLAATGSDGRYFTVSVKPLQNV